MPILYGTMDLRRAKELHQQGIHLHVFLNGTDISELGAPILEANDIAGQVVCYRTDRQGRLVEPRDTVIYRGTVEYRQVPHGGACSLKRREPAPESQPVTH